MIATGMEDLMDEVMDDDDDSMTHLSSGAPGVEIPKEVFEKLLQATQGSGISQDTVSRAVRLRETMRMLAGQGDLIGFEQSMLIRPFCEQEMWKVFGYDSFNKFFSSPERPFSRQSAARYRSVSHFLDEVPLDDRDFLKEFYRKFSLSWEEVLDEFGEVDEHATFLKNRLIGGTGKTAARFSDIMRIAPLLVNKGKITQAEAEELVYHSITDEASDFDQRIKEINGTADDVGEKLLERGILGTVLVVPTYNPDAAIAQMRSYIKRLESKWSPEMDLQGDNPAIEEVGSKSIKFIDLPDGTTVGRM